MKRRFIFLAFSSLMLFFLYNFFETNEKNILINSKKAIHKNVLNAKVLEKNENSNYKKILSITEINDIKEYNKQKKFTPFLKDLEEKINSSLRTKEFLDKVDNILKTSKYSKKFDQNEELIRISLVDFLGDIILGNIDHKYEKYAEEIFYKNLKNIKLPQHMELRQKKSLVGDQIDLISILTQKDKVEAIEFIKNNKNSPYINHLLVGFENGLYFIGYNDERIKFESKKLKNYLK